MQRVLAISFALLLGSAALAAQAIDQYRPRKFDPNAANYQPKVELDLGHALPSSCPVSMHAQQGGSGNMVKVKPGEAPESPSSQSIHLILGGNSRRVASARVKVR